MNKRILWVDVAKADVVQIIEDEMERIANDPNLRHLLPQEDGKQEKQ